MHDRLQVVVLTGSSLEEAKRVDGLCHAAGVKFIWAQARGVFASVFTDFGPSFTVFDTDGGWAGPWRGLVARAGCCEVPPVYARPLRPGSLGPRPPWCPSTTGEDPHTAIVASISNSNPAVVTCVEDERLQFDVRGAGGAAWLLGREAGRVLLRGLHCWWGMCAGYLRQRLPSQFWPAGCLNSLPLPNSPGRGAGHVL